VHTARAGIWRSADGGAMSGFLTATAAGAALDAKSKTAPAHNAKIRFMAPPFFHSVRAMMA